MLVVCLLSSYVFSFLKTCLSASVFRCRSLIVWSISRLIRLSSSGRRILACSSNLVLIYAKVQKNEMHRTGHVVRDSDDPSWIHGPLSVHLTPLIILHSYLHPNFVFSFGYLFCPLFFPRSIITSFRGNALR